VDIKVLFLARSDGTLRRAAFHTSVIVAPTGRARES
jgi:hypothetical protein